jgi:hypothetical protein
MWYTGLDPRTMKPVFVPKTPHDKAMQRALMQWRKPQNRALVMEALKKTGREDLIGYGKHCLVRPDKGQGGQSAVRWSDKSEKGKTKSNDRKPVKGRSASSTTGKRGEKETVQRTAKPVRKAGWAKPAPKKNARKKK